MKISNDAIGNRTRDLPACSAVPQPTAPPCAPPPPYIIHYDTVIYSVAHNTYIVINIQLATYFGCEPSSGQFLI